ncbi:hypothetical protein [Nonomuraea sp. NPDC049758]|uniref:hypothetical protein n=1 Tax=Nonomuraea sp. NPDC049758 TaxID=3154360 RepID=UPI0034465C4F
MEAYVVPCSRSWARTAGPSVRGSASCAARIRAGADSVAPAHTWSTVATWHGPGAPGRSASARSTRSASARELATDRNPWTSEPTPAWTGTRSALWARRAMSATSSRWAFGEGPLGSRA